MIKFETRAMYNNEIALIWSENLPPSVQSEWVYATNIENDPGPVNNVVAYLRVVFDEWEIWVEDDGYPSDDGHYGFLGWEPAYTMPL
jgi:hypothetical protein